jgi:hypothetical protein
MALINIPAKSTGDTLTAVELNTIVDAIKERERQTGWAQYKDNVYTSSNVLSITSGATVNLPNNAGSTITSQLPYGVTSFYDESTTKITPENSGDFYIIRVDFTAYTNNNNGLFEIQLDIGGLQGVIFSDTFDFPRGTGSANARKISTSIGFYTLDTFVANGGQFKIKGITGTTSIYDINFVVSRTHKANS